MEDSAQPTAYLLRNDPHELRRLERQGAMLRGPSELLLRQAGIGAGMRVLDLGTGIGELSFLAAELVGPEGEVVGLDASPEALAAAEQRAGARGLRNVSFEQGDVGTWEAPCEFDAVVGRLILIYVQDPAAVIRHHVRALRPGGVFVAMEYDMPVARTVPATPLAMTILRWALRAFEAGRIDTTLGARLGAVLAAAGLEAPAVLGLQAYLPPGNALGPENLAGLVRTLLPVIERAGIASREEVDIETLQHRLAVEVRERGAVVAPPTLVGAWARHGMTH
jgi:SAM-dependent methyltransferase